VDARGEVVDGGREEVRWACIHFRVARWADLSRAAKGLSVSLPWSATKLSEGRGGLFCLRRRMLQLFDLGVLDGVLPVRLRKSQCLRSV
jgi:hypothetical protein